MKPKKRKYKCKVNGCLGPNAMCGSISVGSDSICFAHGNTKCRHKIKIKEID